MKLNFYGKQIGGTLHNNYYTNHYEDKGEERVQWKDSDTYRDLKEGYKKGALTLKNSFPLWLFVETEEYSYNKIIARIFNEAALEDNLGDNIYPQLQPDDLP
jgi:hypothetical protein